MSEKITKWSWFSLEVKDPITLFAFVIKSNDYYISFVCGVVVDVGYQWHPWKKERHDSLLNKSIH